VPPLTTDKVAQYSSLFEESGAQNGMLSGIACSISEGVPIADPLHQAKPQSRFSNELNYQTKSSAVSGTLRTENRKGFWD